MSRDKLTDLIKSGKDYIEDLDGAISDDGRILVHNHKSDDPMPGWVNRATMKPDGERDVKKAQDEFERLFNTFVEIARKMPAVDEDEVKEADVYDLTPEERAVFDEHLTDLYEYGDAAAKSKYPDYVNYSDYRLSVYEIIHILLRGLKGDEVVGEENADLFTAQLAQNVYIALNATEYVSYDPCREYSFPSIEETAKTLAEQSAEGCVRYKNNYWVGEGDDTHIDCIDVEHKVRKVEANEIDDFVKMVTKFVDEVPLITEPFLENYDDFREGKGLDFELDFYAKSLGFELGNGNPACNDVEYYRYKITCTMFVKEFGVE